MKNLLPLFLVAIIVSCSNGKSKDADSPIVKTETPSVGVRDTASSPQPKEESKQSVYPMGTYKSLPEIMKHVFSEGSTKEEVRIVQGKADFTEAEGPLENWYYGKCVVQFKGPIVGGVKDVGCNLKYADYFALGLSTDKIEKEFFNLLNSRINRR